MTDEEVLRQLDSACRYFHPDRPPHQAFDMAKELIQKLRRRVVVLEIVIAQEMPAWNCQDDLNQMIVDEICNRPSGHVERGKET